MTMNDSILYLPAKGESLCPICDLSISLLMDKYDSLVRKGGCHHVVSVEHWGKTLMIGYMDDAAEAA